MDWTFQKKVAGGHFVRVRLDMVLTAAKWCNRFPFTALRHLTAVKSDHCPIILSCTPAERSACVRSQGKPFRYELMWVTIKKLRSLIQQVWKDNHHYSSVKDKCNQLLYLGGELRT
jgi:hypothetical protein